MSEISTNNLMRIPSNEVKTRIKELNDETPAIFTTSIIKQPQEITLRAVARNNIMLDNILANQQVIIKNQNEILNKLGNNLDISV